MAHQGPLTRDAQNIFGAKLISSAPDFNTNTDNNFIYNQFSQESRNILSNNDTTNRIKRGTIQLLDQLRNFSRQNPGDETKINQLIDDLARILTTQNILNIEKFDPNNTDSITGLQSFMQKFGESDISQHFEQNNIVTEISDLLAQIGADAFTSQQTLLTLKSMEESMRIINGLTDSSKFDRYNNSLIKLFSTLLDKKDVTIFEDVNKTINEINQKMTQMNHDFSKDIWENATKTEIDAQISQLDSLTNQVSHLHNQATTMLNNSDIQDLSMDHLIGIYNQLSKIASASSFVSDSLIGIINTNTQLTQNEKQQLIDKCKNLSFQNNKIFATKFAGILHDKISQRLSEITNNRHNNLRQISNISGLSNALNSDIRSSGRAATSLAQATYTYEETRKSKPIFSFGLSSSMTKLHNHASLISQLEMEYNQASMTIDKIQSQAEEAFAEGNFEKGKHLMDAYKKQMGSLVNLVEHLGSQAEALSNTYNSLSKKEKESLSPDFKNHVQTIIRSQSESSRNLLVQIEGLGLNVNTRRLRHFAQLADQFEEYNKELDKQKDKPTNYLQEIKTAYNEARGIIYSIQSFHRNIFDTFGLGTISLGPISIARETFNYSVEQGRKRYASMSADAFMGVNDLEASARLAQEQMLASNELYRMSGGRISQYAIRDSYEYMVRNMGAPPGISPEQRREDMDFFAKNTVLLQNVYGIDQSTITNGLQFYYRDMRMSADQAANAFAKLTQQAISANVPIDQYLSTFNDLAKQYMTIGIAGEKAGIVLDKLAKNHLRIDIAKEVASQLGQAMSKFSQDKNKVAFAATRLGEDPFQALAKVAYTHDEKGDPRKEWIDDITKYADSLVDAYAAVAGDSEDMRRIIYTDLYKSLGLDRRSTSILLDELFKNGNTSQFKELFKEELAKVDNPNATIEDLNAQALRHLTKMAGILSQADKTEAELKSNLFSQAQHFGSIMDDLLQAFAPLLLTIQGLVLEVTAKIVDWLKEMVSSDLFSQGIEHVKEALKHLPTIFGAFFGFIFLRKISTLVFSLARAVLGPAAVLLGAAIKNPRISIPLAGLAALAGVITNKDSITQSIKNFELPSIELPSFADINIDEITKKFSFFNKSDDKNKPDKVEDSALDSIIASVKNINILNENNIFNEKTVENVKKELSNIGNTITDFRYKLYSKDTDRQDIQAIRIFTDESYMRDKLKEYEDKDIDIDAYIDEQYQQAVDTIQSYQNNKPAEDNKPVEDNIEEPQETIVMGVSTEINANDTNAMIINQQTNNTKNINQQYINENVTNTELTNQEIINQEVLNQGIVNQNNIERINHEIINNEHNIQEINKQQQINKEYINKEQVNKTELTNQHDINTINTSKDLYNFGSFINEFINIIRTNRNQYNTKSINKIQKDDIEKINKAKLFINNEKLINNYMKTLAAQYNKSLLQNDNNKYISNAQIIKDSYNINSQYILNTDWLNQNIDRNKSIADINRNNYYTNNFNTNVFNRENINRDNFNKNIFDKNNINREYFNRNNIDEDYINQNNINLPLFNEYTFDKFKLTNLQLIPFNLPPIISPTEKYIDTEEENTNTEENIKIDTDKEKIGTFIKDNELIPIERINANSLLPTDENQTISYDNQVLQIVQQNTLPYENQSTNETAVLGTATLVNAVTPTVEISPNKILTNIYNQNNINSYQQQISDNLNQYVNTIVNQYTENNQYDTNDNQYTTNIYGTNINNQFNFSIDATNIINQNITNNQSNVKINQLRDELHNLYSIKSDITTNINNIQDNIDLINIDLSTTNKDDEQYKSLIEKLNEYNQQLEKSNKQLNAVQNNIDKTQKNLTDLYDQYQDDAESNLDFNNIITPYNNFAADTQSNGEKATEQVTQDYQNISSATKNSLTEAHNITMTSIDNVDEQIIDQEVQILSSASVAMETLSTGMINQAQEQEKEEEQAENETQVVAGVSTTEVATTNEANANTEVTEIANITNVNNVPSAEDVVEQKTPEQKTVEEKTANEKTSNEKTTNEKVSDDETQKMLGQLSKEDLEINENDSPETKKYKHLLQEALKKDEESKKQIEKLTKDNTKLKQDNENQAKYIAEQNTALKDPESEEGIAAQTYGIKKPNISPSMGDFRQAEEQVNKKAQWNAKTEYLKNSNTYHPSMSYNFLPKTKLPPPKESDITITKIIQSVKDNIKITPTKKIYSPIVGSALDKQSPYAPIKIDYSKHEFNIPDILPTLKPENLKNIESNYGSWDFSQVKNFKTTSINNTGYGTFYTNKFTPGEKSQETIEREKKEAEEREHRKKAISQYTVDNSFFNIRYGQNQNTAYKIAGTTQEEIRNILSKYTGLPKRETPDYEKLRKEVIQRTNYNDWSKTASNKEVNLGIGTNSYKPIEKTPEIVEREKKARIQELQKEKTRLQNTKINTSFTGYTFGLSEAEKAARIKRINTELEKLGVKVDQSSTSNINIDRDIQEFKRVLATTKQVITTPEMRHLDNTDIYKKREQRLKDKYVDDEIETDEETKDESEESRKKHAKKITNKIVSEQYKEQLLAKSTYDLLLEFMDLDSNLFQDLEKSITNEHLQLLYMNNVTNDILKLIDTSIKKAGQIITKVAQGGTGKLTGGTGGIQSGAEPQFKSTGNKLGDIATFAHYWAKQKYGKDLPAFFTRAILRNEAGINLDASGFARDLHNYGGLKYEKWMAEYGVTEFRDEKVPEGKLGLAKFPDDETFVKVWTELYIGPQAYSAYKEAAALAAQGKFREAAEKHAFMYVAGGNPEQWQANHPNDSYEQIVSNIEQILREEYERNGEFGENGLTYQYVPASNAPTGKVDITNNPKHYVDLSSGQIANTSPDTQRFIYAVANAWHEMHPELDPLEITSTLRHGDGSSYHDHGAAFDVANAYFDDKQLRVDYVNLIASLGGTPLDEWEGEPGAIYAHGNNIHATTPNAKSVEGGQFNAPTAVAGAFMIINSDGTIVTNADTDTDADENAAFINPKETNKLETNIDDAEEEIPTIVLGAYQEENNEYIERNNEIEESAYNILQLNNTFNGIITNLLSQNIAINNQSILSSLQPYQFISSNIPQQNLLPQDLSISNQPQQNISTNLYTILNNLFKSYNINNQTQNNIINQILENKENVQIETDNNEKLNTNIINQLLLISNNTVFDLLQNHLSLLQNISTFFQDKNINTNIYDIINQYNNETVKEYEEENIYQNIIEYINQYFNIQDKINTNKYLLNIIKFGNQLVDISTNNQFTNIPINDKSINVISPQDLLTDYNTIIQNSPDLINKIIKLLPNIKNFISKNITSKNIISEEAISENVISEDTIMKDFLEEESDKIDTRKTNINDNKSIIDTFINSHINKFSQRREKLNRYKNKLIADEANKQQHIKKINTRNKVQAKRIKQLSNLEQLFNILTLFNDDNLLDKIILSQRGITNILSTQNILPIQESEENILNELLDINNLSQNIELIPNLLSNAIEFISQVFDNKNEQINEYNKKQKITKENNIIERTIDKSEEEEILIDKNDLIDENSIKNNLIDNIVNLPDISKLLLSPSLTYIPQILQLIRKSFFNKQIFNKQQSKLSTNILRSIFKNLFIPSQSNIIQQGIKQFIDILKQNTYINEIINDQIINELISETDNNIDDNNADDNISQINKLLNQQLIKNIMNLISTDEIVDINKSISNNIFNTNNTDNTSIQVQKFNKNVSIINTLFNTIKDDSKIINNTNKLIQAIKKKDIKNILNQPISSTNILEQINTLMQYITNNNFIEDKLLLDNLSSNQSEGDILNLSENNIQESVINTNLLSSIDIQNIFNQTLTNKFIEDNELINNFLLQFTNIFNKYENIINNNYNYNSQTNINQSDINTNINTKTDTEEEIPKIVLGVSEYINNELENIINPYENFQTIIDNITQNLSPQQIAHNFLEEKRNKSREEKFMKSNINDNIAFGTLQQLVDTSLIDTSLANISLTDNSLINNTLVAKTPFNDALVTDFSVANTLANASVENIPVKNTPIINTFTNNSSLYDFNYTNEFYNNLINNFNKNININPILDINKIINNNFFTNNFNNITDSNSILMTNTAITNHNANAILNIPFNQSRIRSNDDIQSNKFSLVNTDIPIFTNEQTSNIKSQIKTEFNAPAVLSSSMNIDRNNQISSIRALESAQSTPSELATFAQANKTRAESKQLQEEAEMNKITHNIEEKSKIDNIINTYNKNIRIIQTNSTERIKNLTKKMEAALKEFVDNYTATHPSASQSELEQVQQQFIYRNVNIPVTITTVNDDLLEKIKQLCKEQFTEYESTQEQLALILKDYYDAQRVRQILNEFRKRIARPQENIERPTDDKPSDSSGRPDQYI